MKKMYDKYQGNPIEEREAFAKLIVMLQEKNGGVCEAGQKIKDIIPLDEPYNTQLWEHLYHWMTLYIGLPNTQDTLREIYGNPIVDRGDESYHDLCEDCKWHIASFVYKYFWRKWTREEDPECKLGIIISTAQWGFYEWLKEHDNENHLKADTYCKSEFDINTDHSRGRKVCTRHIDWT